MSTEYSKAVKGKLTFKGDKKSTAEKKKTLKRSFDGSDKADSSSFKEADEEEYEVKILQGSGRITSSGLAIQGHYTEFMNQLEPGDAIIITHPTRYIKAPKEKVNEEDKAKDEINKKHKVEENAFGTYASKGGEQFVYRVKKAGAFGGYQIITEKTDKVLSREELLQKRMKKKSDRFCN